MCVRMHLTVYKDVFLSYIMSMYVYVYSYTLFNVGLNLFLKFFFFIWNHE